MPDKYFSGFYHQTQGFPKIYIFFRSALLSKALSLKPYVAQKIGGYMPSAF